MTTMTTEMTKPKVSKKHETLKAWQGLQPVDPATCVVPLPYKSSGSSYGACGVRIDGTPQFIDAVLSCLKSMMDCENGMTRLELARREVENKLEIGGKSKHFSQAGNGAEVCYVRVHERGPESSSYNSPRTLRWLLSNPAACEVLGVSHDKVAALYAKSPEAFKDAADAGVAA